MKHRIKQPYEIIQIDKHTGKINTPNLLLMNRCFDIIGKISKFENWNISLVGNGIDEISFDVHKYADGRLCPVWNDLIDLKIVDVSGFGRFEISVDYTDNTETVKSVHGVSLEAELAQIGLYYFHVNDEEAADMVVTDYSKDNYDSEGKFIPTTFYRKILDTDTPEEAEFKRKHSLLHRVLADKAPHWSIGYVTPCIALDEESEPEETEKFQRTYTANGESIYDFLTGTVAEESNVVFLFDTMERKINCYSLSENVFDPDTGEIKVAGAGEDTMIYVSKNKLANEITISSQKDNVKNCFRVEGGDDIITDMVRAVNMNGSNYIYQFADFQYNDMPEALRNKIHDYQTMMEDPQTQESYYGENGIYTRLCKAYDDLAWYESAMMPDTSKVTDPGSAEEQYNKLKEMIHSDNFYVAVSSVNSFDDNLFVGVTNNIEAYAQILVDSRFDIKILKETTSYDNSQNLWSGKIQIVQHTDEKNIYPVNISSDDYILHVKVNEDALAFAKQKIEKALASGSMLDIDFEVAEKNEGDMLEYFRKYSLNRLASFYDGYNSCLSILIKLGETVSSDLYHTMYHKYELRMNTAGKALEEREKDVQDVKDRISAIELEQKEFMYGSGSYEQPMFDYEPHDFKTYMEDVLYTEFCKYRREDTYSNNNYTSDGLTDAECLAKAKELLEAADKEAKKKCMMQRTISTSLNNLFALPEFEPFYDKFALFNYIRIRTEDELLKLRLVGIEFNGDSVNEIQVTFSDQIESIEGSPKKIRNILKQASNISESYSSTVSQAKKGTQADQKIEDIYTNGLDTGKAMITNNENREVTITSSGIIGKSMVDEGFYDDRQFRITGNTMAFTDDNWNTVRIAIGEFTFEDPVTKESKPGYGIYADNLVGKVIAGNTLGIENENGNVIITGDGIDITNGSIALSNGEYSIELDPNHNLGSTMNDYLFCIRNNAEQDKVVMGVDTSGDGYFSGNLSANSGIIGGENGWKINGNSLMYINKDNNKDFIRLDAENKSVISQNGKNKVTLTSGYVDSTDGTYEARLSEAGLCFKKDNIQYALFRTTTWHNTETRGVGINSYADSKFISFGNMNDNSNDSFITPLVLNYGLNPNGDTQDVLIYGSTLLTEKVFLRNNLYFNNNAWLYSNVNDTISCNKNLYVDNNLDVGNRLEVLGNLFADGALENLFDSAPNLCIGGMGRIAKTTGSSKRFKKEIKPVETDELNPDKLYDINVVQYKFKKDYLSEDAQRYDKNVIGFIAEDIYEKYPIAADCSIDPDGNTIVEDWNFRYIVPAMLKLIQDQKKEIHSLKQKNKEFSRRLEKIEQAIF